MQCCHCNIYSMYLCMTIVSSSYHQYINDEHGGRAALDQWVSGVDCQPVLTNLLSEHVRHDACDEAS